VNARTTAVLACWCALITACGFPVQDSPSKAALDEETSPIDTTASAPNQTETVTVWFVNEDRLAPSTRDLPAPADALTAVTAITAGVSASESALGLRTAIPDTGMITDASVDRGTATVTLAPEFLDIPSGDQVFALGQLVYTLTDLRGVGRVRFEIGGEPVVVPLPDGESTDDSVSREDFAALVSPPLGSGLDNG